MPRLTKKLKENFRFAREVALEYGQSPEFMSQEKVAEKYGITRHAVAVLIKIAIVNFVISYKDAKRIQEKERRNTSPHYLNAEPKDSEKTVTDRYFDRVFAERKKFLRENYASEKKCKDVIQYYIDHPQIRNVYDYLGLSREEMNFIIIRGIVYGYIDEETYVKLKQVGTTKNPKANLTKFEEARRDVTSFKSEISKKENQIALLQGDQEANAKEIENLRVSLQMAKASLIAITTRF
jgi:virulence-associated protein VapD